MQKLIILDYRNGVAVVLPVTVIGDEEEQVATWCANNQTTMDDCEWMAWDGEIRYEE